MTTNSKRVVYFEYLQDPVYETVLAERPDISLTRLEYASPDAENWRVMAEAHAYQATSARDELPEQYFVNRALIERCPRLLVVSTHGAGYDTIDLDACTEAGVLVVNQAGGNKEAVAEHVLAMMLCLSKRILPVDRVMRREAGVRRAQYIGNDVKSKTVGIIGLGNVGARVAELCRAMFDTQVLAHDPYLSPEDCVARGAEKVALDDLLRRSDFISINCPRTAETTKLIGAREYALMKPTAYFITTARGGIHDEEALRAALAGGRLAGAGLDVWDKEPPPLDHPLLQFDNVVVSPHTAGVTRESRYNIAMIAAEQLIHIFDGQRPPRLLNPDVWPKYAARFERTFGARVKG